jgi:hypothetical protein
MALLGALEHLREVQKKKFRYGLIGYKWLFAILPSICPIIIAETPTINISVQI